MRHRAIVVICMGPDYRKPTRREDMSTSKKVAEPSADPARVGRITALNMPSETNGLSYDSLLRDMPTANDKSRQHFDCSFWA